MWKLLKADIEYNRSLLVFLYTAIILASVLNSFLGGGVEYLAALMFFSVAIIGVTAGLEEMKTKRIRLFAGLPVKAQTLGIFRYPVFITYWLSMMVLLWLSGLLGPADPGPDFFWWLLTRSSTVFVWIACMNLGQDLPFSCSSKGSGYFLKWTFNLGGAVAGPMLYFATNPRSHPDKVFSALAAVFNSAAGALSWFVLSLVLTAISVVVYQRRRAFTE